MTQKPSQIEYRRLPVVACVSQAEAIGENLGALGIPRDHIKVLVRDLPRENWGIPGGQAGSDLDIRFAIEV